MFKYLLILAASCAMTYSYGGEKKGTFELTVENIKQKQGGKLVLYLYRGQEAWLNKERALISKEVSINGDTMKITFKDLPHGNDYALQVFHDANDNGKIDFRIFPYPKPKEGVAVSNNHSRMGKPKYDKAKFSIDKPTGGMALKLIY